MFKGIISTFKQFKNLQLQALGLGLTTRIALEQDLIMKGISRVQENFPQLTESGYDSDEDTFKIENKEQERAKQALIRVEKKRTLNLLWGVDFPFGEDADIINVFNQYQESTSLLPVNIAYVEFLLYVASEWEGNHYTLIWNTFFKGSPIFGLFEPKSLLQDDLLFRALLSDDVILRVEVASNVKDSEVRNQLFKDDMLRINAGIAKTRGFLPGIDLAQTLTKHIEISQPFIIDRLIPSLVAPLDAALATYTSRSEDK